jgi:PAS domain S-box-containing protein
MAKKKKEPLTLANSSSTSKPDKASEDIDPEQLLTTLRESEKRYRSFIENFHGIAYEADVKTWTPIFFHGAVEEITGYKEEDFTAGKPRWDLIIHPDDLADLPGKDEVTYIPNYSIDREYRIICKDGQERWVREFLHNISDGSGKISRLQGTLYDITERKQMGEALRKSEKQYRGLVESALVGVTTTTLGGDILYANDTFLEKLEYESLEEFARGGTATKYKNPEKRNELIKQITEVGRVENFEVELLTKSGKSAHFLESCTLDGGLLHCTVVDITERKQAQQALQESEQRYRTVADFTYDWEYWINPDGTMRYVSPACERITGYTPKEFLLNPYLLTEIITPETLGEWEEHQCSVLGDRRPRAVVFAIRHKEGGVRWIEHVCQPVIDENGNSLGSRASNRDITTRKQIEGNLRRRTHDLGERVKELNCLYNLSKLIEIPGISLEEVFQGTVNLIPPAWQYPEVACARLTINDQVFTTEKFKKAKWKLTSDIVVGGVQTGLVEVFYTEEKPEVDEGPFMKEERDLLDAIAERLGGAIQRRQAEDALRESESLLRKIAENFPNSYLSIIEKDLTIGLTSGQEFQKRKLDPNKYVGMTIEQVFGDKADLVREKYLDTFEGNEQTFELIIDEQNQLYRTVPLYGPDGSISRIFSVVENITERKQAEEALKIRSRQQMAVAKLGLNTLACDSLQVLMDEAVEAVSQTLGMEFCGVLELMPDQSALLLRAGVGWKEDLIGHATVGTNLDSQAGYTLKSHIPVIVEDLQSEARFTGSPLLIENGIVAGMSVIIGDWKKPFGVLGVHTCQGRPFNRDDINFLQAVANLLAEAVTRKQVEEEIRKLNEELEQRVAERTAELKATNEELEAFAYSISHDLRAPLRAINSFSKVLKEKYVHLLGEEGSDYLDKVVISTLKMDQLINDLLALSRLGRQEFRRTTTNLTYIVNRVFKEMVAKEPDRDIRLKISDLPLVRVDAKLIEVMLDNLFSNAAKFTRGRTPAVIEFGCMFEGEAPTFYLRDNGVGFDMKYADKLFSPFQRLHTEREFEGTGIGLAIVRRIVNRHGGKVWVEAEPDKGATFYFTLE